MFAENRTVSEFETAGVVLEAFHLAFLALQSHRELATRLGLFQQIRLEYKKWHDGLEYHRLTFTRHLRQRLQPLVADDEKIQELLSSHGRESWKNVAVPGLLEQRFGDSYPLYLECIMGIERVVGDINRQLSVDSGPARGEEAVSESTASTTLVI